jgi:prepilin-type N-terminal cleavage/methylation domain-containing protein
MSLIKSWCMTLGVYLRQINVNPRGFSLIEILIVVVIVGIIAVIAVPSYSIQVKNYRLTEYSGQVEYLTKYGRMMAMEKTTNVGICVNGNNVSLRDITTTRTAAACSGTQIMNVAVDNSLSVNGASVAIDPRGLIIGNTGSVCISSGNKFRKVWIDMTGTRIEEGSGGCT